MPQQIWLAAETADGLRLVRQGILGEIRDSALLLRVPQAACGDVAERDLGAEKIDRSSL